MKKIKIILSTIVSIILLVGSFGTIYADSQKNKMVEAYLWNETQDKPSMGGIMMDNNKKILYKANENVLQIATNPVNLSEYISAVTDMKYYDEEKQEFLNVKKLKTDIVKTGKKYDGKIHDIEYISLFEIPLPKNSKKNGIEYILLKSAVPYTPMDAALVGGMITSRLRINWDNSEITTLSDLKQNKNTSSGNTKSLELRDEKYGIKIRANTFKLPENSKIAVNEMKNFSTHDIDLGNKNTKIFDISVMDGKEKKQPQGSVSIELPYTGNEMTVYRINDNGSKTLIKGSISDEGFTMTTRKLGKIAIVNAQKIKEEKDNKITFLDIENHWAKKEIIKAVTANMFKGTSQGHFNPEGKMTNGMVITVIYRIAGEPKTGGKYKAIDSKEGEWYEDAVSWGIENKIVENSFYKDGFHVNDNVTRESLATMIYRYNLIKNMEKSDISELSKWDDNYQISDWAKEGVAWNISKKIIKGNKNKVNPKGEATRAEVATMLCRFKEAL